MSAPSDSAPVGAPSQNSTPRNSALRASGQRSSADSNSAEGGAAHGSAAQRNGISGSAVLRNPALLLTWGLPLVAVLASFATLSITLAQPDSELPEQYHWEGFQLDRDFSRAARAAELHVNAQVTGLSTGGVCQVALQIYGASPAALNLRVAHGTLPQLDQKLTLHRVTVSSDSGLATATYAAQCRAAREGHWRLELSDVANTWAMRKSFHGSLASVSLVTSPEPEEALNRRAAEPQDPEALNRRAAESPSVTTSANLAAPSRPAIEGLLNKGDDD